VEKGPLSSLHKGNVLGREERERKDVKAKEGRKKFTDFEFYIGKKKRVEKSWH